MPSGDMRTAVQVRLDELERRVNRIEPMVHTAIAGAVGVGFVTGLFAKAILKMLGL